MAPRVSAGLSAAEGRRFGLTLGGAFAALAALLGWRGHGAAAVVLGGIAGALLVAALLAPSRMGPVERGWMAFALALSRVTTPLLMGLVYYVVIAPIGIALRLAGKNPIARRTDAASFWVPRSGSPSGGMEHPF